MYYLSALSEGERSGFADFLSSPIFNRRTEPHHLYRYLIGRGPLEQQIDPVKAWKAIWPGQPYSKNKFAKLKSELLRLLMKYLEFQEWELTRQSSLAFQTSALLKLNDESFFPGLHQKALRKTQPGENLEIFRERFDLSVQMLAFQNRNHPRNSVDYLPPTLSSFERMVNAYALKLGYVARNQKSITGSSSISPWLSNLIDRISPNQWQEEPLLETYFLLFSTLVPTPPTKDLHRLRQLVLHIGPTLSAREAFDIYTGTINNFHRQQTIRGRAKTSQLFLLYRSFIDSYVFEKGGQLSPAHLKNLVSLGSRLGEWAELERILGAPNLNLPLKAAEIQQALDYNRGVLRFHRREFQAAEQLFQKVIHTLDDVFYTIDARAYLLMCFYENENTSGMENLTHAFNMFLRRNEAVSGAHKQFYLAFLKVWKHFLHTPSFKKDRLQKLQAEVATLQDSAGREWLMEKINGMT